MVIYWLFEIVPFFCVVNVLRYFRLFSLKLESLKDQNDICIIMYWLIFSIKLMSLMTWILSRKGR